MENFWGLSDVFECSQLTETKEIFNYLAIETWIRKLYSDKIDNFSLIEIKWARVQICQKYSTFFKLGY